MVWDDKRYSASVHYRLAEDRAEARRILAAVLGSAPGAEGVGAFFGKLVLEIVPPTGVDKGYAVRRLVRENRLDGAFLLGDDTTDVAALKDLRATGELQGAGVAVIHKDSPPELARSTDYVLNGVPEVEVFLEWLAAAADRTTR